MLYSEIENAVCGNLGRSDSDTKLKILRLYNFVQKVLAKNLEVEELETLATPSLTAGAYRYTIANLSLTGYRKIYSFNVLDGSTWRPVKYVVPSKYDLELAPGSSPPTGKPFFWTMFGGYIEFEKQLDEATSFRIRYYAYPTDMVDTESIVVMASTSDVGVAFTTALVWLALEEPENAKSWIAITETMFNASKMSLRGNFGQIASSKSLAGGTLGEYWKMPFVKGV